MESEFQSPAPIREPVSIQGTEAQEVVPVPTKPVFDPEAFLIEKAGSLGIWLVVVLYLVKTLNLGTLFSRWAAMPDRVGELARSVESLADGLTASTRENTAEHQTFRDHLHAQEKTLSRIDSDLDAIKDELRRRLLER